MGVSTEFSLLDVAAVVSDASIAVGRIVQGDTTNTTNAKIVVKAATGETTKPVGVTLEATTSANSVTSIRMAGIALVNVDGSGTAIDIGDAICATTGGQGVKATTADADPQWPVGIALAPSAASGDLIPVLLTPGVLIVGGSAGS